MPPLDVQSIVDRSRDEIVELIGEYIHLKKQGTSYVACCPFHDEKTPSLSVNPKKGIWKCFGCGAGTSPIDFIMQYDGLEFIEVIRKLAKRWGYTDQHTPGSNPNRPTIKRYLTPGLAEAKQSIRKEGKIMIRFSQQPITTHGHTVTLNRPIYSLQAKEFASMVEKVELYPSQTPQELEWTRKSIYSLVPHLRDVHVEWEGSLITWVDALIHIFNQDSTPKEEFERAVIRCIAAISEPLERDIWQTYFVNQFYPH